MSTPIVNDVRAQFDTFAVQLVARQRLISDALESLSAMVRTADAVLATFEPESHGAASAHVALIAWVRLLRGAVIRLLAVAGPDASWLYAAPEAPALTAAERECVAGLLLDPQEPNQHLRDRARRYRAMIGI